MKKNGSPTFSWIFSSLNSWIGLCHNWVSFEIAPFPWFHFQFSLFLIRIENQRSLMNDWYWLPPLKRHQRNNTSLSWAGAEKAKWSYRYTVPVCIVPNRNLRFWKKNFRHASQFWKRGWMIEMGNPSSWQDLNSAYHPCLISANVGSIRHITSQGSHHQPSPESSSLRSTSVKISSEKKAMRERKRERERLCLGLVR